MATFVTSLRPRLVYVFAIADTPHHGCLKIGETSLNEDIANFDALGPNSETLNRLAHNRIAQYTQTAGISYELLYTELTLFFRNNELCSFNDSHVHRILERSGIERKEIGRATEWYQTDLATVKKAINAAKEGRGSLHSSEISKGETPIILRPEQREAVDRTIKQFRKGNQMLWNAKMRFGKTICALQVTKEMAAWRTIIVTHRPVVDESWFEDFNKIFRENPEYKYGSKSKGESFHNLEEYASKGKGKYVYFASMQDMRGSQSVGGKFDKNDEIFSTEWDLVIVDEAHEGTQTELGQAVLSQLISAKTKTIRLSGTPFNLLDDYKEDEIFTWDYVMEQKAKQDWELYNLGEHNPYASLPAINIYTYDLAALMSDYGDDEKAFNFREFFRVKEDGNFLHDQDVDHFLNLLCKDSEESLYPYSNDKFRNIFRHTLWMLPGVKAAKALSKKLNNHPIFGAFKVVNVAGDGDEEEENRNALELVNTAIGPDSSATYTITLSCGRLTTGVSIKPWTGVFMLAGASSTSAAGYMQTIFRVQTPYTHNGRMKTECYAFDFAPDRTLRILAETAKVSTKAGKQSDSDREILSEFLNFCPIISIEGGKMREYNVDGMLGQLKRAQIERVVQGGFEDRALYNDRLFKLSAVELSEFDELKATIGKTKAMPRTGAIDINRQGLSNEQYEEKERLEKKKKKDRTPEEEKRLQALKAIGDQRRNAIAILRGISIRMPLMLYGADIKDEDKELTIDNFTNIADDQSWEEFMPRGVTKEVFNKFKQYYDPDVFREAGKRIRDMARAADKFTIEERIDRITAIFATFRNPDKETVLTPWRVVNMHLGDTLGGYCFMDEDYSEALEEPRYIEHKGVTKDVFRSDSIVMEINSKSGLYPLYATYSIYRARVEEAKEKYGEIERAFALSLWDRTLRENLLVVCKTPMARSITVRTLAGFRDTKVYARYYPDLIDNIIDEPASVVNLLRSGKRFWEINDKDNMKIDAIIGNPPYQIMDGGGSGTSATATYNLFIDIAKAIAPTYISMIVPARWYTGGKGLDRFRETMLADRHIKKIYDYPNPKECFPNTNISGGVCYFLWDQTHHGLCDFSNVMQGKHTRMLRKLDEFEILIRYNTALSIIKKIVSSPDFQSLSKIISARNPFGLPSATRGSKIQKGKQNIKVYSSGGVGWINRDEIVSGIPFIDRHKVFMGKVLSGHLGEVDDNGQVKVITSIQTALPTEVCTDSYLLIGGFKTSQEAHNLSEFLKTKTLRYLLLQALASMNISRANFRFVPYLDFKMIWTDDRLYEKYDLSQDEIGIIEKTIRHFD